MSSSVLECAELNGYLRAFAEWNQPSSNLTYTFTLTSEGVGSLDLSFLQGFYETVATITAIDVRESWQSTVEATARKWLLDGWKPAHLKGKALGSEDGICDMLNSLLERLTKAVDPVQLALPTYGFTHGKKYQWYEASWDDLWLVNARAERYLLHFGVTD